MADKISDLDKRRQELEQKIELLQPTSLEKLPTEQRNLALEGVRRGAIEQGPSSLQDIARMKAEAEMLRRESLEKSLGQSGMEALEQQKAAPFLQARMKAMGQEVPQAPERQIITAEELSKMVPMSQRSPEERKKYYEQQEKNIEAQQTQERNRQEAIKKLIKGE